MNCTGVEREKEQCLNEVVINCLSDLLQVAAKIKNDAFSAGHELRFISPMINVGDDHISNRVGRTA